MRETELTRTPPEAVDSSKEVSYDDDTVCESSYHPEFGKNFEVDTRPSSDLESVCAFCLQSLAARTRTNATSPPNHEPDINNVDKVSNGSNLLQRSSNPDDDHATSTNHFENMETIGKHPKVVERNDFETNATIQVHPNVGTTETTRETDDAVTNTVTFNDAVTNTVTFAHKSVGTNW